MTVMLGADRSGSVTGRAATRDVVDQAVVGGDITFAEEDWVVLMVGGLRLAFQQAEEFAPPTWPTAERPQQFHLDLTVDDVDAAGHPFCLCWD